jgi:isoquinoline 1-oxidoreductase beta subunit
MLQRRSFLKLSAATGGALFFGLRLTGCSDDGDSTMEPPAPLTESDLNAYVRIASDDTVTLYISRSDMGQGVLTALPMILAEELEADWSKVRSAHPIASEAKYGFQGTGGSFSVRTDYEPLRKLGAAAREMLIAAAAMQWGVPASECRAENGEVIHGDGAMRARYGELAELAATLDPPAEPVLKDRSAFRLIGKSTKSLNARAKAEGTAEFGLDVKIPNMLVALVAHSPVIGGTVTSFDDAEARKVPGVRDVVQIPSGVAVLADHYWAALKGREALEIVWDDGPNSTLTMTSLRDKLVASVDQGVVVATEGTTEDVLAGAPPERVIEAVYELPYLAHATMEPLNCVADVRADSVELWSGHQFQTLAVGTAAQIAGVMPDKVTLHVPLLGGGFGRRAGLDFISDAVATSKAAGKPVKLLYNREDDTCATFYRPMSYNVLRGSVDENGVPNAWLHKIVTPALPMFFPWPDPNVDPSAIEGAADVAYGIPNKLVSYKNPEIAIPTFFWRSVGHSLNGFVVESFIDELAALGGKDPLELRLQLLADHPRQVRALERVADLAGWDTAPPAGTARGIAVHESFGTIVAEVAEVSVDENNKVRVHRVSVAVDCGEVINPINVEAQVESSIVYGLTAALYGEITIEGGRPMQDNFHTYPMLRMQEMPKVDVAIIAEGDPIGGMGEPALPPVAPAVCNALFALTGQRIRKLPIRLA